MPALWVIDLGWMEYDAAHALQEAAVAARSAGRVPDLLLFVEHPPVYTLGRGGREEHLLVSHEELAARGAILRRTARGGDITYHGPGQLVGYPILDLGEHGRDLHRYLRGLEESLIRAVAELGVTATRVPRLTGVWVGEPAAPCAASALPPRKIAAIGVAVKRWVTYHGFALNVTVDLERFRAIVPCGLHDRGVTSLHELVPAPSPVRVRDAVTRHFAACFDLAPERVTLEMLQDSV
jgi:lipoyl(octanoyl) transferase